MLPLDLHVLGLPLAFILSQDQTLHRCFLNIITTINCLYSKMTYLVLILNYLYHSSLEKCTRCQFNKSMNFPDLTRDILVEIKGLEPLILSPTRDFFSIFLGTQLRCKRLQIYNAFSLSAKSFLEKFLTFFLKLSILKRTSKQLPF